MISAIFRPSLKKPHSAPEGVNDSIFFSTLPSSYNFWLISFSTRASLFTLIILPSSKRPSLTLPQWTHPSDARKTPNPSGRPLEFPTTPWNTPEWPSIVASVHLMTWSAEAILMSGKSQTGSVGSHKHALNCGTVVLWVRLQIFAIFIWSMSPKAIRTFVRGPDSSMTRRPSFDCIIN